MTHCRLRDLPVGGMARIEMIRDTHRAYRSKLLSMGLTRGTPLQVRNIAPLGDPIIVSVRGFDLSLRRDEADALVLELLEGDPQAHGFRRRERGHGRRRGER
jgi:ferrous iron transport protein A